MPRFAQIAVNVPGVRDVFDYRVPGQFEQVLDVGWLVEVPFGSQTVQGIILKLKPTSEVQETRPIEAILESTPVLTGSQLSLAAYLSEIYLGPLSAYLFAMLPPGLGQRADTLYQLNQDCKADKASLSHLQKKIVSLLEQKGPLRGRQLEAAFRHVNWRSAARALNRQGYLTTQAILPKPGVKIKQIRSVSTSVLPASLDAILDQLGRSGSPAQQRRLTALKMLANEPEEMEVSWVYASSGATSADLKFLEKQGLITFHRQETWRDPLADKEYSQTEVPYLTEEQNQAWRVIQQLMDDEQFNQPVLLHGVTGSGKTELYMRAIQKSLQAGRQALVIVPEISMTPQTIDRFLARFPDQVGVIHSKLSTGERYDTWRRAQAGDFSIAIGPRSALFTPFPNVGVIIVDECHDDSLYQVEMGPYYHAVKAAAALGRLSRALVIFGTATPTVEMYFQALYENWPLLKLPRRVLAHRSTTNDYLQKHNGYQIKTEDAAAIDALPLPDVKVVDMREELKNGNLSIFSRALQQKLDEVLAAKQQAILLLNRRGSASYVFCRNCGYTLRCPRCDLSLTYHRSDAGLVCHTCGYSRKLPVKCPQCASPKIKQFGLGTEKVETDLQKMFPRARILRWDADTSKGKGAEEVILSHFKNHNADILIGTQMLAKGLDLPLVTLVGVVLADIGLNFPDFRTAERTFQLLTQVAGRAGRSALGGKVIIQTFQPENYAIECAARHDFAGFYRLELVERRKLGYPPFTHMLRFESRDKDNELAREKAQGLANRLKALIHQSDDRSLSLNGPLPPYFARRNGLYRWQIILKGSRPEEILKNQDFSDFIVEIDPPSLL
jgi:primosomal protein N' (replication factor Y)